MFVLSPGKLRYKFPSNFRGVKHHVSLRTVLCAAKSNEMHLLNYKFGLMHIMLWLRLILTCL